MANNQYLGYSVSQLKDMLSFLTSQFADCKDEVQKRQIADKIYQIKAALKLLGA